jgi:hypothetical protein
MVGVPVMARGGRATIDIDFDKFYQSLDVFLTRVDRGTKKATKQAAEEILEDSLRRVPRSTSTLANSAYYQIEGKYKNFGAIIGYGGNGNPRNPDTGLRASQYMIAVHEDLEANHPIGEAKFLEKAVIAYQRRFVPNVANTLRRETGL